MKLLKAFLAAYGCRPFVNVAVGLAAVAAVLIGAPDAKADPFMHDAAMVCRWLDVDNSPASIQAMFLDMIAEGLSHQQSVDTVTYALVNLCSEHSDDLFYANEVINGGRYGA
jgi:hypothetical protein